MARRNIYEYDSKKLLAKILPKYYKEFNYHNKIVIVESIKDLDKLIEKSPWLKSEKLVIKPDQLFGKRGKNNLILLDANVEQMKQFCIENIEKIIKINNVEGKLNRFLIEPFIPHKKEYYVSITSERENDIIHFSYEGGIFIEENWDKVIHIPIPLGTDINSFDLSVKLHELGEFKGIIIPFIKGLYQVFIDQDFTFLEINPFAISLDKKIVPLDVKARLDDTAFFLHPDTWGTLENPIQFPSAFGETIHEKERLIRDDVDMDEMKWNEDDNRYIVLPCNNCGQYMYIIKKKKSKKCPRCGCSNKLSSNDYFGEMLKEINNTLELFKQKRNELAFKVKIQYLLYLFNENYIK